MTFQSAPLYERQTPNTITNETSSKIRSKKLLRASATDAQRRVYLENAHYSERAVRRDVKARRRPHPRVRDRGCSLRKRGSCVMSLARAASAAPQSTSTVASRCHRGGTPATRCAGLAGRSRATRGSCLGTVDVACVFGRIPRPRGSRTADRSAALAWRALPGRTLACAYAAANAGLSDDDGQDYGTSRRPSAFSARASSSSLASVGFLSGSLTRTHGTRASGGARVETTSAEAAYAAAAADVASGRISSLRSKDLNEALQYLGKGPNYRLVFEVFDQLRDGREVNARAPNAHVATTVLSVAGRRGDLKRVRDVFTWMKKQGPGRSAPTAYTYTAFIQAVGGAGDWRDAFAAYRDMRAAGIIPTSHTYSALIRGGAKGGKVGASAAAALVEDMKADRLVPDVPVASALICAYGVLGQFQNAERMLHAAEAAVKARRAAYSSGTESGKPGKPKQPPPLKPDARLYTEFLIASCRCGRPDAAADIFEREDFPRTTYTCTAAIKAYGECDMWQKAEELYASMTQFGKGIAPTTVTHTAMLSAYEKCGEWRRAVSLLQSLRQAGPLPETHYNVVMSACGKAGEWREAEKLLENMRGDGRLPSAVTYSVLIAAYGRAGEEDKANIRFKEMVDSGLVPDDYTFVGLMLAPATRGDLATCMEIKRFMLAKHGCQPTVHVWNECVRAADTRQLYETAVDLYQSMLKEGIEPNATTRDLLERVGKNGVEYYEDKQIAASFGTLVASLVGVAGMMVGRW